MLSAFFYLPKDSVAIMIPYQVYPSGPSRERGCVVLGTGEGTVPVSPGKKQQEKGRGGTRRETIHPRAQDPRRPTHCAGHAVPWQERGQGVHGHRSSTPPHGRHPGLGACGAPFRRVTSSLCRWVGGGKAGALGNLTGETVERSLSCSTHPVTPTKCR